MNARPVVGGVFLKLLYDRAVWKKWAGREKTKAANWASFPKPPKVVVVAPTSEKEPLVWRYTTQKPAEEWFKPEFDATSWQEGPGGFGTSGTPGATARTQWKTADIWLRREFTLPDKKFNDLCLSIHHDEDAEIYINGVLAARARGFTTAYEELPLNNAGRSALKAGKNLVAIHCHQTQGGQYIDAGFSDVVEDNGGR
jgi:hypothetical protein